MPATYTRCTAWGGRYLDFEVTRGYHSHSRAACLVLNVTPERLAWLVLYPRGERVNERGEVGGTRRPVVIVEHEVSAGSVPGKVVRPVSAVARYVGDVAGHQSPPSLSGASARQSSHARIVRLGQRRH